jgi:hypothetical protein
MKIRFVQDCTVFPNGERLDALVGDEREIADADYAQLLIDKGHAVKVGVKAPAKAAAAGQEDAP